MAMPLEISFKNMEPSEALETRIREQATKLERFYDRIIRCHVTVEAPHRHQHQGRAYEVRVLLNVPDKDIAVTHEKRNDPAHEDVYVAVRDAFQAVTRQLQDYARIRRGEVKRH